jgi:hypothetical protein
MAGPEEKLQMNLATIIQVEIQLHSAPLNRFGSSRHKCVLVLRSEEVCKPTNADMLRRILRGMFLHIYIFLHRSLNGVSSAEHYILRKVVYIFCLDIHILLIQL